MLPPMSPSLCTLGPPGDPGSGDPPRPPAPPEDPRRERDRGLATKQRSRSARPPRFKVILYNDDYTPMEFVVHVLEKVFGKSPSAATQIMLQIHRGGMGVAGVYVLEVAETKSATVHTDGGGARLPAALRCGEGMSSIGRDLQLTLQAAHREAVVRRHAYLTVEHLLYALIHNEDGARILLHSGADVDRLRRSSSRSSSTRTSSRCPGTSRSRRCRRSRSIA